MSPIPFIIAFLLSAGALYQFYIVPTVIHPMGKKQVIHPTIASGNTEKEATPSAIIRPTYASVATTRTIRPTETKQIVPSMVPTATNIPLPLSTSTPKPQVDTEPPVITSLTGPGNGSTVDFHSFCFPVFIKDNVQSGIMVRYSFDGSGVSDWNTNYAPCYQNVSNGSHTYTLQAKDAAGNMTGTVSKSFIVNVPVPTVAVPTSAPTTIPSPTSGITPTGTSQP
jgi:hypothetical protein